MAGGTGLPLPAGRVLWLILLAVLLIVVTVLAAPVAASPAIQRMTPVPNETLEILMQGPTKEPTPLLVRTTSTPSVAKPATKPPGLIVTPDPAGDDEFFENSLLPKEEEPEVQETHYPFDRSYEDDGLPEPEETGQSPVEGVPSPAGDAFDDVAISRDEEIDRFTQEVRQADPAFAEMTVDDDAVSLSFSRKARLLGFIETGYMDVVRVTPGGSVEVDQPWWLGFAVTDDRKTSSDYATMFENFDQKANQFFNILSTAKKNEKEMNSSVVSNLV
ncbi:MAG TPA: hypothetical protein HA272_02400 [Methanoregula sp.]|nr:hypothetical protein [Methanoregula sp.]